MSDTLKRFAFIVDVGRYEAELRVLETMNNLVCKLVSDFTNDV